MESIDLSPGARCPGKLEVPTAKEKEALDAMRVIKGQVRELKKRLVALRTPGHKKEAGEVAGLEENMARLKEQWDQWEKRRQQAAKERMIQLGHEKD